MSIEIMQKQISKIPQAHDGFTKASMKDMDIAKDVLTHHLPLTVQKKIKLETLELEDGNFTTAELSPLYTDILYSVDLLDSPAREKAYIFLHVEHQSYADPIISFRIIQYCVQILDRYIRNTGSNILPVIIPTVIYNGKRKFSDSISIFDLFGDNKAFAQEYMFNSFHLVDMNTIPDEEIRQRKFSYLMEMTLKHIHDKDIMDFLEKFEIRELFKRFIAENPHKNHVISVVKYLNEKSKIDNKPRFLTWVSKNLPPKLENEIMTLAEQWINEGHEKGMQQGMQRGIQRGIQQGKLEGERALLIRMLERRFGEIPAHYLMQIEKAGAYKLLQFGDKLVAAEALADVFESCH